jgi:drug/metabolite transporter (DMT)-like permease
LYALLMMVVAALGWTGFDALRKNLSSRLPAIPLVVALTLGQVPLFAVWLATSGLPTVHSDYLWPAALSVAINVAANVLFVVSVRMSPLSVTIPMLSFSPVFSAAIAALPPLHEIPGPAQWLGSVLVVAGALLLNAARASGWSPRALLLGILRERGALVMTAVALLFALSSAVDKVASSRSSAPLHALVQCAGVGLVLLAALAARGELSQLRAIGSVRSTYAAALVVGAAALGFQMSAFSVASVSAVETVKRAVGMTASQVIGRVAFGEPLYPSKWVAVLMMAVGCWLLLAA